MRENREQGKWRENGRGGKTGGDRKVGGRKLGGRKLGGRKLGGTPPTRSGSVVEVDAGASRDAVQPVLVRQRRWQCLGGTQQQARAGVQGRVHATEYVPLQFGRKVN